MALVFKCEPLSISSFSLFKSHFILRLTAPQIRSSLAFGFVFLLLVSSVSCVYPIEHWCSLELAHNCLVVVVFINILIKYNSIFCSQFFFTNDVLLCFRQLSRTFTFKANEINPSRVALPMLTASALTLISTFSAPKFFYYVHMHAHAHTHSRTEFICQSQFKFYRVNRMQTYGRFEGCNVVSEHLH